MVISHVRTLGHCMDLENCSYVLGSTYCYATCETGIYLSKVSIQLSFHRNQEAKLALYALPDVKNINLSGKIVYDCRI